MTKTENTGPDRSATDSGTSAMSRRRVLKTLLVAGAAVGLGGIDAASSRVRAQSSKVSKAVANYQDNPKDGHKCSGCTYFQPPHACRLVEGDISPDGWCQFWTKQS